MENKTPKPFLGVLFRCCGVYARVYRSRTGDNYTGRCPKCLFLLRVAIDPKQGVAARFLEVR